MMYSIIYSVDIAGNEDSITRYRPTPRNLWDQTEGDRDYEYSDLSGVWATGKHRKWGAILDQKQFDKFVSDAGLCAEDCETGGSLGSPGCGFGFVNAIAFNANYDYVRRCAYVAPCGTLAEQIAFVDTECGQAEKVPEILRKLSKRKRISQSVRNSKPVVKAGEVLWQLIRRFIINKYR